MVTEFLNFLHQLQVFELASVTLLLGVLVATTILRICGINPGGILGSAFFLLAASDSVLWALSLLLIAILISWLYDRFLSNVYSGREPIFLMSGMSVIATVAVGLVLQHFDIMSINSFSFPLGIILPAIIASNIRKQGLTQTYRFLALAIVLTIEGVLVAYGIGQWLGYDYTELQDLAATRQTLELSWSSLYAFASVIIGIILYRRYQIKAAGFIILPVLATIAVVSPLNFALLMVTAAIVYGMSSLLRRQSLVIGTSRYALISTLSITLVWTITYLLLHNTKDFAPYMGTGLFASLAITVLVNDHTIYGIRKAFPLFAVGLAAMACIEVGSAYIMAYTSHDPQNLRYYVIRESTVPYPDR